MLKILLVEDDPMMGRMYVRILTYEGFLVERAEDGEAGLQKVKQNPPDLILLDVMMQKMNGMDVLKNLKADPATSSIPVIMLTNLAGEQDQQTALQMGAIKYLVKSEHQPKEVVQIVKEVLNGVRGSS